MSKIAAILDFRTDRFQLFLIYKSPSFKSIGLSVQGKKRKTGFQDGGHGSHLGFPNRIILAVFDLQVTPMLPTKL